MIIIKIGGSAFSNKTIPLSFNEAPIRRLALLIRSHGMVPVIVHGGGSFAHPVAKAYGLNRGIRDEGQLIGVALIFSSVGLPTYTLRTGAVFMRSGRELRLSDDAVHLMRRLVSMSVIPMLYGDVIIDDELGFSILSGDDIMVELARALKPSKALFLMDVDGVYTKGPGRGELIRVFKPSMRVAYGNSGIDATGGLANKLTSAIKISSLGVETYLCSINDGESISRVLSGIKPMRCTKVEAD
jgi:isopentenyl phosphate kinase